MDVRRLDLRWSRWDYNIQPELFWQDADPTLKIQFGYMEGLYRVLDTLMKEHPNWMVEQCAGGGKRTDIGTMKRAHTYWFSDQTFDQSMCRYMQARANRFLPGHLLNSSVAVQLAGGDAGSDPMTQRGADWGPYNDTSILSRMLGKLSFDGDIASWSGEFAERASRLVAEFKTTRHLMVQDFYQLLPMPETADDWDAVQFVSYPGDAAALFVFAGQGGGRETVPPPWPPARHGIQRWSPAARPPASCKGLRVDG